MPQGGYRPAVPRRRGGGFPLPGLLLCCLLAGCAAPPVQPAPPPGAIRVGEDLYQVPLGKDADGYPRFTLWSRTRAVITVIWYPDGEGGFTTDRSRAVRTPPSDIPRRD